MSFKLSSFINSTTQSKTEEEDHCMLCMGGLKECHLYSFFRSFLFHQKVRRICQKTFSPDKYVASQCNLLSLEFHHIICPFRQWFVPENISQYYQAVQIIWISTNIDSLVNCQLIPKKKSLRDYKIMWRKCIYST